MIIYIRVYTWVLDEMELHQDKAQMMKNGEGLHPQTLGLLQEIINAVKGVWTLQNYENYC